MITLLSVTLLEDRTNYRCKINIQKMVSQVCLCLATRVVTKLFSAFARKDWNSSRKMERVNVLTHSSTIRLLEGISCAVQKRKGPVGESFVKENIRRPKLTPPQSSRRKSLPCGSRKWISTGESEAVARRFISSIYACFL